MQKFIQCERLEELGWLVHGSTTRLFNPEPGGKKEELAKVAKLRTIQPKSYVFANQKHTNHAVFLCREQLKKDIREFYIHENTDAVGTDAPGVLAGVFTADCIPLFLVDAKNRKLMLVHSGWRGTLGKIAQNALKLLIETGTDPKNVIAWLGPAIGICCYIVSLELAEKFAKIFPSIPDAVRGRYLDLKAINAFQLEQNGVLPQNIIISPVCTKCQFETFYSYRAQGRLKGRIINFAMIKD